MPAKLLLLVLLLAAACAQRDTDQEFACPTKPLRGVYDFEKFRVIQECQWVSGDVEEIDSGPDETNQLLIAPVEDSRRFLSASNYNEHGGRLPILLLPDQKFDIPDVGERISVFGTWVVHADDDWNAMHPVWAIKYVSRDVAEQDVPAVDPEKGACICWREKSGRIEFLLVRTGGDGWTLPQGHIEPGETTAQTAALEARQEGGVEGQVESAPLAFFLEPEDSVRREVLVAVHLLKVQTEAEPLEEDRDPTWFGPSAAVAQLAESRADVYVERLRAVLERAVTRLEG